MDGVPGRWNSAVEPEPLGRRRRPPAGPLSRLAILVAQAELQLDRHARKTPAARTPPPPRGAGHGEEPPDGPTGGHIPRPEPSLTPPRSPAPPGEVGGAGDGDCPEDQPPGHAPVPAASLPRQPGPPGASEGPALVGCAFCPKAMRSGAGLHSHMRRCHAADLWAFRGGAPRCSPRRPPTLLGCRSCDRVFSSTASLYLHRSESHSRDSAPRAPPLPAPKQRERKTHACRSCDRVFMHHLSLRAHAKQHALPLQTPAGPPQTPAGPRQGPSARWGARPSRVPGRPPGKAHRAGLGTGGASLAPGRRRRRRGRGRGRRGAGSAGGGRGPGDRFTPKQQEEEEEEEEVGREFPCPSCPKVFPRRAQLRSHAELHGAPAPWGRCSVCLQGLDPSGGPAAAAAPARVYHCVPCQRGFPALDAFLEHCQDHLRLRVEEDHAAEAQALHSKSHA